MLPNHLLTRGPSERELYSGKIPLRSIQRIGFLIVGMFLVGLPVVFAVAAFSAMQKESIFLSGLIAVILFGWFIVFFTLGWRMIWAALTAPSVPDDSEDEEDDHGRGLG